VVKGMKIFRLKIEILHPGFAKLSGLFLSGGPP
jgi:hypothetical protein